MVSLDVKDRGLFRENAQGQIENIYLLKVINKTERTQHYACAWSTPTVSSCRARPSCIPAGEMSELPVSVAMLAERPASSSQTAELRNQRRDQPAIRSMAHSRFVAPMNR
jgi:polyferredoxin